MSEHSHVHAPHELTEPGHDALSSRERGLELSAVLLLSIATLCIAWSGYQAIRWSGLQARRYAQASTARALANRALTLGGQERLQDLLNFNRWLETTTTGDTTLSNLYARRFRPEFRPAFTAWIAQNPLQNDQAIASPLQMPQYRLADLEKADRLEHEGDRRFDEAKDATEHADDYIFGTVFFAAVLFFAGISMRFAWTRMRFTVLVLAAAFLLYGIVQLTSLPTL